jgi:hypothetical protein
MKEGDKVTVVNPLHAYRGRTGTIAEVGSDDEGDFIFVTITDSRGRLEDIFFEPNDIKVTE